MAKHGTARHEAARHAATEPAQRGSYVDPERYRTKRKERERKGSGRMAVRVLVTCVVAIVAGVGIAVGAYLHEVNSNITHGVDDDTKQKLEVAEPTDPGDSFYMLLLGIDRNKERAEEEGSSDELYRTDTMILAHVNPQEKTVQLVSIPRDTKVDLGEYGTQKINAAFTFGGPALAIEKVEELAGVDIEHYAEIDMDGFAAIVDSVDGVDVDLPVDVYDPDYTGLDLKAGEHHLDGETAALLGRTRHAYDEYGAGDYYRTGNQRMLIQALASKILSSDLFTIANTVRVASSYVTTDMDVTYIINLASWFAGMKAEDITSGLCPTQGSLEDGIWYEVVMEPQWTEMMNRVRAGESPYSSADQDITAGVVGKVPGAHTTYDSVDSSSSSSSESSTGITGSGGATGTGSTTTD